MDKGYILQNPIVCAVRCTEYARRTSSLETLLFSRSEVLISLPALTSISEIEIQGGFTGWMVMVGHWITQQSVKPPRGRFVRIRTHTTVSIAKFEPDDSSALHHIDCWHRHDVTGDADMQT